MSTLKMKKGDTVKVITGKDRGKTGAVTAVYPKAGRILVSGVNVVVRHRRPRRTGQKGEKISLERPIAVSNVMLLCPHCKTPTRVGKKREEGVWRRACKKCGHIL